MVGIGVVSVSVLEGDVLRAVCSLGFGVYDDDGTVVASFCAGGGRGHHASDTILDPGGYVHCSLSDYVGDVAQTLRAVGNGISLEDLLGHHEALPPCKLTSYDAFRDLLHRSFRPLVLPGPKKRGYHPSGVYTEIFVLLLVVVPVFGWIVFEVIVIVCSCGLRRKSVLAKSGLWC